MCEQYSKPGVFRQAAFFSVFESLLKFGVSVSQGMAFGGNSIFRPCATLPLLLLESVMLRKNMGWASWACQAPRRNGVRPQDFQQKHPPPPDWRQPASWEGYFWTRWDVRYLGMYTLHMCVHSLYIHVHTHAQTPMHTYMHTHIHTYTHTYIDTWIHIYTHISHIYIYLKS